MLSHEDLSNYNNLFNDESRDSQQDYSFFDSRLSRTGSQNDLDESENGYDLLYYFGKNPEKKIENKDIFQTILTFKAEESKITTIEFEEIKTEKYNFIEEKIISNNEKKKITTIEFKENTTEKNNYIKEKIKKNLKIKFLENSKKIILSKNLLKSSSEKDFININISDEKNLKNFFFNFLIFLKVLFTKCKCSSNCSNCKKCKNAKKFFKKINRNCNLDKYSEKRNLANFKEMKKNFEILKECENCSNCKKNEIKITPAKGAIFKFVIKNLKDTLQNENEKNIEEIQKKNKISKAKIVNYLFFIKYLSFTDNTSNMEYDYEDNLFKKMEKNLKKILIDENYFKDYQSEKINNKLQLDKINTNVKRIKKIKKTKINKKEQKKKEQNEKKLKKIILILNEWFANKNNLQEILKVNFKEKKGFKKRFLFFIKNIRQSLKYLKEKKSNKCKTSNFEKFLMKSEFYILHYFTNNNDFLVDFSVNLLKKHKDYSNAFNEVFKEVDINSKNNLQNNLRKNSDDFELNYYLDMLRFFKVTKMKEIFKKD